MRSQTGGVVITIVLTILTDGTSFLTLVSVQFIVLADGRTASHVDGCFLDALHYGPAENGASLYRVCDDNLYFTRDQLRIVSEISVTVS